VEAILIFPNQLFDQNKSLMKTMGNRISKVYLVEAKIFFKDHRYPAKFHKLRLILHRASMKRYTEEILGNYNRISTEYIECSQLDARGSLYRKIRKDGVDILHAYEPEDDILKRRLLFHTEKNGIRLKLSPSPHFLTTQAELCSYFSSRQSKKRYHHQDFYKWQRRRLQIFVDQKGRPEYSELKEKNARWSFDVENRKKWPSRRKPPSIRCFGDNKYVEEAIQYVSSHWPNHCGNQSIQHIQHWPPAPHQDKISYFIYPTNHQEAQEWLQDFFNYRFENFGPYEDAMHTNHPFLHHSLLSPLLNIGLLNVEEVVTQAIEFSITHQIPIASLEGFLRQLIGWREFIRAIYTFDGVTQRTSNFFGHTRILSDNWYQGTTGLAPIDLLIQRLHTHAYCHHIERLMLIGNIMLLCEIHPNEVYRWFMEMYIDAYDWVMVPNVYGMSQFADGGMIVTKPYISSSNYLMKMSNFQKLASQKHPVLGCSWTEIWDGLFWRFIDKHQKWLLHQPRMRMLLHHLDGGRQTNKIKQAQRFLNWLDTG